MKLICLTKDNKLYTFDLINFGDTQYVVNWVNRDYIYVDTINEYNEKVS